MSRPGKPPAARRFTNDRASIGSVVRGHDGFADAERDVERIGEVPAPSRGDDGAHGRFSTGLARDAVARPTSRAMTAD